jgi:hypothetical protein
LSYGKFELAFERRAPAESIRRDDATGALVRIKRDLSFETQQAEALGRATFGLKKIGGAEGHVQLCEATFTRLIF